MKKMIEQSIYTTETGKRAEHQDFSCWWLREHQDLVVDGGLNTNDDCDMVYDTEMLRMGYPLICCTSIIIAEYDLIHIRLLRAAAQSVSL